MTKKNTQVILTIDDEEFVRSSFSNFLEDCGYDILEAENGRIGLDVFSKENPDLVLVDLRMPEIDGLEVLAQITKQSPETPVIVVSSGTGMIDDAVDALRHGAWDYILKPVSDLSVLSHAVQKCLERAILKKENREHKEFLEKEVIKRTKQLEYANEELEKRVVQRTLELQKTNIELIKAKDKADAAAQAKSDFLANMSHEIRTPMNGVITIAELALSEEVSPKIEHYLKIIHSSGTNLLGIINDILDFSKIEAGKLDLERKPFKLNEMIDSTVAPFINNTIEKEIELIVDIDLQVSLDLIGDKLRIQQVLTNLIGNAFKFTEKNGVIVVKISQLSSGQNGEQNGDVEIKISVKDSGLGMSEQVTKKLFQPFTQADTSTTRKYGGTGLGLSISKQLVEMMGGKIGVISEEKKGSEFYFTLCLQRQKEIKKAKLTAPVQMKNKKVLIVDDNLDTRTLVDKIISSFGCKVNTVSSGIDAIEILGNQNCKKQEYHIIIMDWKMPKLDGIETAKEIRQKLKLDIPIILMSAFGKKIALERDEKKLINGFLNKPFHAISLFDTMVNVTGSSNIPAPKRKKEIVTDLLIHKKRVKGMHILLAEDNLTNQEIARIVFKTAEVSLTIASNGKKAVEALEKKTFDVILMDIQMPEMDGYEATNTIRADPKYQDLPIIAMTAHAMKGDEEKCLNTGMNGYVSKPINQAKLFKTLSSIVKTRNGKVLDENPSSYETNHCDKSKNTTSLPGIDVEKALNALGIDKESYINILQVFGKNNKDYILKMRSAFNKNNWDDLRNLAHSIRGSSGSIGANKLHEISTQIEDASIKAFKDTDGKFLDEEMMVSFENALNQVLNSIKLLKNE